MAQMLFQQQTYRTPNLNIHQTTSTQNGTLLPKAHPVNDGLYLHRYNSTNLLNFFQRLSSQSQKSLYPSTSNKFLNKNSTFSPLSNTIFVLNEPEEEEQVNNFNCDKIEPVIAENTNTEQLAKISAATIIDELEDGAILNTTSSLNVECEFCKPKQSSSLTRTSSSSSNDETGSIITDSIQKTDDNNNDNNQEEKSQKPGEILEPISIESLSLNENNEKKEDNLVENDETNNKNPPSNRFRGRKLRYRLYHHTSSTSKKPTSDNIVQFVVPTQTPIAPSSSPSSSSSISLTTNVLSPGVSPNILTGVLKRKDSTRTTKKTVCFADAVGRELTQVQYIQSSTDDDSKESLFVKNNLYTSKASIYEYKPWSFDIALTSKQIPNIRKPKRFFCLYRQPTSEHPDIYLHEIRKSHIKLEHADICLKSSSTGEQYLYGTLWVTNDNYRKNVIVKYTFNQWLNTYEYKAQHRYHSNDSRNIDQFEFSIDIPHDVYRIDFILCYFVNGQEHWDNNEGNNYTLETESVYTPQTTISLPHDCDINEMRFY